jgi:hypothetical protein
LKKFLKNRKNRADNTEKACKFRVFAKEKNMIFMAEKFILRIFRAMRTKICGCFL